MHVFQILASKGRRIVVVDIHTLILDVCAILDSEQIGSVVVLDTRGNIAGILSEKDIVRGLSRHGLKCAELHVGDLMSRSVVTCDLNSNIDSLMREMTSRRMRHIPVVENEVLVGIVSIGDIVKNRVDELESESEMMQGYIAHG